jgi:tRNA pseudouridine(38-40) synthase
MSAMVDNNYICDICHEKMSSKNQLFKHLQTHGIEREVGWRYERVVILFGWKSLSATDEADEYRKGGSLKAFQTTMDEELDTSLWSAIAQVEGYTITDRASSRCGSSAGRASHMLGIEASCHGACDVFSCTLKRLPIPRSQKWVDDMNSHLPSFMHVMHIITLPDNGLNFHAESQCTQRLFEYVIPLEILVPTDSESRNEQDTLCSKIDIDADLSTRRGNRYCVMDIEFPGDSDSSLLRIKYFRILKKVLKLFGGKHHLHNFATGGICPDDAIARRDTGRFYHKKLLVVEDREWAVFSVSGDAFLRGQVRKMLGLAIGVIRGWIPMEYAKHSLEANVMCDIPLVPGCGLYLAECKYDKWEAKYGVRIDPRRIDAADTIPVDAWLSEVRACAMTMVNDVLQNGSWLSNFKNECMRVCAKKEVECKLLLRELSSLPLRIGMGSTNNEEGSVTIWSENVTIAYARVLDLLRKASDSGLWPVSSQGRQKVINSSSLVECGGIGGTFSIGALPSHLSQPKGNELFPGIHIYLLRSNVTFFDICVL